MKVLYIAPLSEDKEHSSGYASASDGILYVLQRMVHEGYIESLNIVNNLYNFNIPKECYDICIVNQNIKLIVSNYNLYLKYYEIKKKCKKIYFSFVWESIPYPKKFDTFLNSDLPDGFLCPSEFVEGLLKNIDKPKFLYPHYIDTEKFKCIDIEQKKKEDIFTVLILGQNTSRKGHKEAIISFCQELGNEEDCRLIIKTNRLSETEISIEDQLNLYCTSNGDIRAKIYDISDTNLCFEDMLKLYHSSSIVLLPSKGEGFGLNLYEAMSCGLPCIYTPYHAWDDMKLYTDSNYIIDCVLDSVTNMNQYGYDLNSLWFQPKIYSIKNKLRESYESWKKDRISYFTNSIDNNRELIVRNYEYSKIKEYIINILNITEFNEKQDNTTYRSLCTYEDFENDQFKHITSELKQDFRYHRKLWEWVKITEVLDGFNMLEQNKQGIGFAVGQEPLPSYFVKRGCFITASDYIDSDIWKDSNQLASNLDDLNKFNIIDNNTLEEKINFENVDMNNIPKELKNKQFDFLWSSCALEHLGNLDNGIKFIKDSLNCLRTEGIAVHTTEFNCYSNDDTITEGHSVIYRKKDIEKLKNELKGIADVGVINYDLGNDNLDYHIDYPPYSNDTHLKLFLDGYICTSLLIVIKKL